MNQSLSFSADIATPRCRAVALLVDGENVTHALAGRAILRARQWGPVSVLRVYGDARRLNGWHEAPGFRLVHAHAGKNVTDMLMCVEAMELGLTGAVDGIALASNDRDFAPLALALRARGIPVLGLVGASAPAMFRQSCTAVIELAPLTPATSALSAPIPSTPEPAPPPAPPNAAVKPLTPIEHSAHAILAKGPVEAQAFSHAMQAGKHSIPQGSKNWRAWLKKTFPGFRTEGEGQKTRYAIIP